MRRRRSQLELALLLSLSTLVVACNALLGLEEKHAGSDAAIAGKSGAAGSLSGSGGAVGDTSGGDAGTGGGGSGRSGGTAGHGGSDAVGDAGNAGGGEDIVGSIGGAGLTTGGSGGTSSTDQAGDGGMDGDAGQGADAGAGGSSGSGGCAGGTFDNDADPGTACAPWFECQPGQHVGDEGTPTSDRSCVQCAEETFSEAENAASCETWQTCESGEFIETNGSLASDRECSECAAGSFSGGTNAESCMPCSSGTFSADPGAEACEEWSDCAPGTYVSADGSVSEDRHCTTCPSGTQSTVPNQSQCLDADACPAGSVETAPASESTPAECDACAPGDYCAGGTAPKMVCASGTWDHDANPATACTAWTNCLAGTEVNTDGTTVLDRTCAACDLGSYSVAVNAPSCTAWSDCSAGNRVATTGTTTTDRTCVACSSGTYSTSVNAGSCTAWSDCTAGNRVSAVGTTTSDRGCVACSSGTYTTSINAGSCTAWSDCAAGSRVATAGTTSADRTCTGCSSGTYSTSVNAGSCTAWSTCSAGSYVATVGTTSADRTCAACSSSTYSTTTNASSCTSWTDCAAGTRVATTGSTTTNRTCTACSSGTFTATTNAPSCATWSTCTWALGGVAASGTASSDTVCGPASPYRQLGTSSSDYGNATAVDASSNVYVAGSTAGSLDGTSAGGKDAFLRKYDVNGSVQWTRQFGTTADEEGRGVAVDASGNVYVAGTTAGGLSGSTAGGVDAFLRKYDASGVAQWTKQFGSSSNDAVAVLTLDGSGNPYVGGAAPGTLAGASASGIAAFIRKYDSGGALQWTWKPESNLSIFSYITSSSMCGAAVDGSGNVYVAGSAEWYGGPNHVPFVLKYNSTGTLQWGQSFAWALTGSEGIICTGLARDGNSNLYLAGYTDGNAAAPNAGSYDVFVRKYDSNGYALWTSQFGTTSADVGTGVATDSSGNVFIAGYTAGVLSGSSAGSYDAFVRKYDTGGNVQAIQQFGTTGADYARAVALDATGNRFVAGQTTGAFVGMNAGGDDVFLAKLTP